MPVSYILFTVMKILKEHNRKTTVSRDVLSRVVGEFFIESLLPEEVKHSLLQDYDFNYEIEVILDKYASYLTDEDGMITLSPYTKIEIINDLLDDSCTEYDEELLDTIKEFYDFNIPVLEMLGIKMEKELYKNIMDLERDIEINYDELARCEINNEEVSNKMLYELKKGIVKRNFVFSQIEHGLTLDEYNDLYMYSKYRYNLENIDTLPMKIENEDFDYTMESDPFHRALFIMDSNRDLVFTNKFYNSKKTEREEEKNKERFFTGVIDTISEHTSKYDSDKTHEDLVLAKYSLMYAIDSICHPEGDYDGYLFMGNRRDFSSYSEDYSFIEKEIFYLIDEIFEYSDNEIANDIIVDYNNAIKAMLIITYYNLTKDERVIEAIKNHPNYGNHHFTSQLFDGIVKNNKKKIRKKEDE